MSVVALVGECDRESFEAAENEATSLPKCDTLFREQPPSHVSQQCGNGNLSFHARRWRAKDRSGFQN